MGAHVFPSDLVLTPVRRWPTTLPESTVEAVLSRPANRARSRRRVDQPAASIVIVTHNGLVFSRLCLESLLGADSCLEFEVVVVDNASTDGTVAYLRDLAMRDPRVRVDCSAGNLGFAAATNRGVALASGELLVLLNNDTVPLSPWLERMARHLADPAIGLVGAVTNRAGNEAEIATTYRTYGELESFVSSHASAGIRDLFDIRTATMFCVAIRRDVWDEVGPLDEVFEMGLFEDDDYSMRVRASGLRVVCAEDVFVHHFGQASIGQLAGNGAYGALFHANRMRWEAKWGRQWKPYSRRRTPAYEVAVERVRRCVMDRVPAGASVLVVSKGDEQLLRLGERCAAHFPQGPDGVYAGHHPSDSDACIAELERLRANGAGFLVIPASSRWWLQHYAEFSDYLSRQYVVLDGEDAPAVIVALRTP